MKKVLGAIAAAVLLGTGCAHNRETPSQTETPTAPQASVEGAQQEPMGGAGQAGTASAYNCEVISPQAAGTARSELIPNECIKKAESSPSQAAVPIEAAQEDAAIGGAVLDAEDEAIRDSSSGNLAKSGPASEKSAIGGSASQDVSASGSASGDVSTDDSISEDTAFEDTDMGGTGGGGG